MNQQSFIRIANSVPGVFGAFCAQKARIERVEENSSEQLRLRLAVELNGERKRRTQ